MDLHELAARVLAVLSYASLDLGRADSAMHHALAMEKSAQLARHSDLEAWSSGTQALILRFDQRWPESIERAEKGLNRKSKGSVRARLHGQIALAAARLGDKGRVEREIGKSDDAVDRRPEGAGMTDGILLFSRAKHHFYAGVACGDLGGRYGDRAASESRQALQLFVEGNADIRSYSDKLLAHVHVARGLLVANKIDEIPPAMSDFFASPVGYRTAWHIQKVDALARDVTLAAEGSDVAEYLESAASTFSDQIRTFT